MAKRGRKKKFKLQFNIQPSTVRSISALAFFLLALIILVSFFAPDYSVNSKIQLFLRKLFGFPSIIVPFVLAFSSLVFIDKLKVKIKEFRIVAGLFLMLLSVSGLFHVVVPVEEAYQRAVEGLGGGMVGFKISSFLSSNLSVYGAVPFLLILSIVSVILTFDVSFDTIITALSKIEFLKQFMDKLKNRFVKEDRRGGLDANLVVTNEVSEISKDGLGINQKSLMEDFGPGDFEVIPTMAQPHILTSDHKNPEGRSTIPTLDFPLMPSDKIWQFPPHSLLLEPAGELQDLSHVEISKKKIKDTLRNFGIDVEIVDIQVGSSVTQYSLQTNSITRIAKIASLHEDLALALASSTGSIRIEAPMPGKSLIGVEVPNKLRSTVRFKSLLESESMKSMKSKLSITLGKDVAGKTYCFNISDMPHMLIAGTTGSGKSIFIHNIMFSILFRASPQEVKFILVDLKRVELVHYKDIPHLLTPVVTDMDKVPSVFKWAVEEMDKRLQLLEKAKVRNIDGYNEKSGIQVMPYIVIVVDELAEIMTRDQTDVEKSIIRIAALARATGIHLILAVQRPSTNIITGVIKANIPCRVAFQVASQIDSRVIIDHPGAEKLLGKGDMLFVRDVGKPRRLQSAMIEDKEINSLVSYLKEQGVDPDYREEVLTRPVESGSHTGSSSGFEDEMFDKAVDIVLTNGKASASLLQRKLSIGYARAARIIDGMEEKHIIGPAQGGSKAREVIIDSVQFSALENIDDKTLEEPKSPTLPDEDYSFDTESNSDEMYIS